MVEQTSSVCNDIDPITVTPFGVDVEAFTPLSVNKRNDNVIRVGTVKTLEERYGVDILIDAVSTVRDALRDLEAAEAERLRFIIVGGGSRESELKQKVRDLNLEDITTFTGQVPHKEVPRYLNELDVYVAPSRKESFGVAVLEASACGCPVIVSDVGGLPEVVRDGETGIIVRQEDPAATAEAILRLFHRPKLRVSMGKTGRSWVQEQYSWNACVGRMESVYERVVTKSKS